jgi:molybdopterin-guanine dinucleotide biosynthesis protein A
MDVILDHPDFEGGPGVGILSAHKKNPKAAWLVVACDFPFVDSRGIEELISNRIGNGISTVYKNIENSIEPLFAIWEPETLINFMNIFENGEKSPRRFLERSNPKTLAPHDPRLLVNINSLRDAEPYPELQRL